MALPYMRLYVADYIADTQDFTCEEHGAYMLLIMHYWRNGGLPDDEERIARIAKLDAMRWQSVRLCMLSKFTREWRHKRIDEELEKAEEKSLKAAVASAKSWEARGKLPKAYAKRLLKRSQSVGKASQPSFISTSSTVSGSDEEGHSKGPNGAKAKGPLSPELRQNLGLDPITEIAQ